MKKADRRSTSFDLNFSRYAAATAAAASSIAATANADFSNGYSLTPPAAGGYSNSAVNQTFGDWTGSATVQFSPTINTTNAPSSLSLAFSESTVSANVERLDLTTAIKGSGLLSFAWNFSDNGPAAQAFGITLNGAFTSIASSTSNGNFSIAVNPGDIFGFRLAANYNSNGTVTISNFTAPVPEPAVSALIAVGAVALIALREVRRRRAGSA